jgi:hypothetical protein
MTGALEQASPPAATSPVPTVRALLPRITPTPSTSVDEYPTTVVVQLETTLLIPDYPLYYDTPVSEFNPSYNALSDGSLVTAPFRSDLKQANGVLLLLSVLATIFLRNTFISGNYIRRIRVRRKILFKTIFLSQLIAFVGLVPQMISFLTTRLNCSSVAFLVNIAAMLSIILIMSGTIGYKAYKCLDNSILVLILLSIFTIGDIGVVLMDLITLRGATRLSGSCARIDNMLWLKIFIMLQLGQSLFLCCCFLYAVWKSRHSPVARDRISIQLSMDLQHVTGASPPHLSRLNSTLSYKPEGLPSTGTHHAERFIKTSAEAMRQNSISEEAAVPPMQRSGLRPRRVNRDEPESPSRPLSGEATASLAPSTFSRLSQYMPQLFRKVMQDELWYTTIITSCCCIVAVIAVVGATSKDQLSFFSWICLYWAVASILAMHSFGRAINRHEREALLQSAVLHQRRWDSDRFHATNVRRPNNNWEYSSSRWLRRIASDRASSYGDTQALTHAYSESVLSSSATDSPSSPRSINSRSSLPLTPSPTFHFPTSGRTTPLVPLDSTRAILPETGFVVDRSASGSDFNLVRAGSGP